MPNKPCVQNPRCLCVVSTIYILFFACFLVPGTRQPPILMTAWSDPSWGGAQWGWIRKTDTCSGVGLARKPPEAMKHLLTWLQVWENSSSWQTQSYYLKNIKQGCWYAGTLGTLGRMQGHTLSTTVGVVHVNVGKDWNFIHLFHCSIPSTPNSACLK